MTRELFYPFIHTLLMGLPHIYRDVPAATGSVVEIEIPGESGGTWFVIKQERGWLLRDSSNAASPVSKLSGEPISKVSVPPPVAWKLFTKGLTPLAAEPLVSITGDRTVGLVALNMVAVMA